MVLTYAHRYCAQKLEVCIKAGWGWVDDVLFGMWDIGVKTSGIWEMKTELKGIMDVKKSGMLDESIIC